MSDGGDGYLKLVLRGFRVQAAIGAHGFEQGRRQPLLVSVELYLEPAAHRGEDRLEATLDYDFLRDGIRGLLASRHYVLQEKLCEDILELCFGRQQVVAVRVRTEKTEVYPDCDAVGVEIFRRRAGRA